MADITKELKEALVEGVNRLINADQSLKQLSLLPSGKTVGAVVNYSGGSGTRDDNRATTGYDPVTGLTTVAFVLGVSPLDGPDVMSE